MLTVILMFALPAALSIVSLFAGLLVEVLRKPTPKL